MNSSSFGKNFPEHLARLKRIGRIRRIDAAPRLKGARLARKLKGCRAVIASVQPYYDAAFFRASRDIVLLARHGIGVNNVDLAAATREGVVVTKVPGFVEREAMAEHTLALILAAARRLFPARSAVAEGRWRARRLFMGFELKGKTVGVIGFGNIGSHVAGLLSRGLKARVLACDPWVSRARMKACGARRVPLEYLLRNSDVITLHASLNPTSRRMISARALRMMRPGAVIVNTARGELVDEAPLVSGLKSGRIGGLGADTVAREPAGPGHPFLKCPNVILVPHIGAYTRESLSAMGDKMVADVVDVLVRARRPREIVNPEVWRSGNLRLRSRC